MLSGKEKGERSSRLNRNDVYTASQGIYDFTVCVNAIVYGTSEYIQAFFFPPDGMLNAKMEKLFACGRVQIVVNQKQENEDSVRKFWLRRVRSKGFVFQVM